MKIGFLCSMAATIVWSLSACQPTSSAKDAVRNREVQISIDDSKRFKQELERLNDSSKVHVHIADSARIIYATAEDVLSLKNGIVLFGWPRCPWFRNAIEPLLSFAEEEQAAIYYVNIYAIRDTKELQDGHVVTTKEGSAGYQALLSKFQASLNPYTALGVDSIKRISSPTVLFIENGEAVYKVVSTVRSQTDPSQKLDSTQRDELKQRYRKYFLNNK